MSEKLIIKNFGPLKDVDLDLRKVNVFIGESGTGKSTVAKVLALCRYFSFVVEVRNGEFQYFESMLESWNISRYWNHKSYIEYSCEDYTFKVFSKAFTTVDDKDNGHLEIKVIREVTPTNTRLNKFSKLLESYKLLKSKAQQENTILDDWQPDINFYLNDVTKVMNNPFYIHTERNLTSYQSISKTLISSISSSLERQFVKLNEITKQFRVEVEIEPLNILYKNDSGRGMIKNKSNNSFFNISNAASGFQSVIPIVLVIKDYLFRRKKVKSFIIEEPEQNIFPTTQNELVKFFAENLKGMHSLFITTHSPYILTSLNNLMLAYQVGNLENEKTKDEVTKIISEKYWVNPEDVACFMLEGGKARGIIDGEDGLILADYIDGVSVDINNEYLRLNEIKINNELAAS